MNWKTPDLNQWDYIGQDDKCDYFEIYIQALNSPRFKRNFRVLMVVITKSNKYILMACTELQLDARTILHSFLPIEIQNRIPLPQCQPVLWFDPLPSIKQGSIKFLFQHKSGCSEPGSGEVRTLSSH